MATPEVRRLKLWQDRIETEVEVSGSGPPLVYLHGPWGLAPRPRPSSPALPKTNTVYAPKFPGTSRGDPDAVHALEGWHDLVVYYGELFDKLELPRPRSSAIRSAGSSPPSMPRRRRDRSAAWC